METELKSFDKNITYIKKTTSFWYWSILEESVISERKPSRHLLFQIFIPHNKPELPPNDDDGDDII